MATTSHTARGGPALGGSAAMSFVHGSGQVDSDIIIEWDFDNDGDFSETVENVTSYLMSLETVTGRDYPSSLTGLAGPGQMRATFLNDDDRFSYFNASSPLATAPFSLRTGRKVRVRDAATTVPDPVLLARDRFRRPDGALGGTETGQTWTEQVGTWSIAGQTAQAGLPNGTNLYATVDVGETSHYTQVSIRQTGRNPARLLGLIVGWVDANNHTRVYVNTDPAEGVKIVDRAAGVTTVLDGFPLAEPWEGMTIGASIQGQTVTAYVAGAPVCEATIVRSPGTATGLYANYAGFTGRAPEFSDFYVWDTIAVPTDGAIWTGSVDNVDTPPQLGGIKVASVAAEGELRKAAAANIASPRLPGAGAPTGMVVGDVFARARLMHPPAPLDVGSVTTGPVGIPDGPALTVARMFEETERGFIHETPEGYIGYDDAAARATAPVSAVFSDAPGAQFGYSSIVPLDHKGQIINRVTAGVAPDAPSGITHSVDIGSSHVDVTMPTVTAGALLVVFIASTVDDGHDWLAPIWWTEHRDLKAAAGMRVYSHWCDGTESGTTVRFYANTGASPGLWAAQIYQVTDWFQSTREGIALGEPTPGRDSGPMVHGWGRAPTLFIIAQTGIGGSGSGGSFDANFNPPDGYGDIHGQTIFSGVVAYDAAVAGAHKVDCTESENPTEFPGLSGYTITETAVFAVRGYNGPHTKATLEDPNTVGGEGRFVTVEDVSSQDEHNTIRTHESASNLFASEADAEAYGESVLAAFADDRPIITLSFPATKNAAYRAQAIRRRVGHKIHVTASGVTGLGIDGDFFIENISHRWANAGKHWETTWQLSPA